jgi:hypothetical protein
LIEPDLVGRAHRQPEIAGITPGEFMVLWKRRGSGLGVESFGEIPDGLEPPAWKLAGFKDRHLMAGSFEFVSCRESSESTAEDYDVLRSTSQAEAAAPLGSCEARKQRKRSRAHSHISDEPAAIDNARH